MNIFCHAAEEKCISYWLLKDNITECGDELIEGIMQMKCWNYISVHFIYLKHNNKFDHTNVKTLIYR